MLPTIYTPKNTNVMEDLPNIPTPKPSKKEGFGKYILYTFIGTTLSIILTFGTGMLVEKNKQKKARELTAMMVMGNIENFAQRLDLVSDRLCYRDTLATMLLNIPEDSVDAPEYAEMVMSIQNVLSCPVLTYDKTVEQIFSNSIETWKNMGNFMFIDNVGECFNSMKYITDDYMEFAKSMADMVSLVKENADSYPGKTIFSKTLLSKEFRENVQGLHRRASYCKYMSEVVRYYNSVNMVLMKVTKEEVQQFIDEHEESLENDYPLPQQQDYLPVDINPDSLPDYQTWYQQHQW